MGARSLMPPLLLLIAHSLLPLQFVFPIAFVLFCTIYFSIYSSKHSKLDQKCIV